MKLGSVSVPTRCCKLEIVSPAQRPYEFRQACSQEFRRSNRGGLGLGVHELLQQFELLLCSYYNQDIVLVDP